MKLRIVQALAYSALSVVSLWAATGDAQQQGPRLALKLTSAAQEKQKADPNFIASLLQRTQRLSLAAPKITVDPLIQSRRSADLAARIGRAAVAPPNFQFPNFDAWYQIQVGTGSDSQNEPRGVNATAKNGPQSYALPKDLLDLIHTLHKYPEVESVHALQPGPPPAVNANDDPRNTNQGYLNAAPQGINARYAWGFTGGDGAGANIVDVEQGWNFNHEDLKAAGVTLISGRNAAYFGHGTSVLGEMVMVDNTIGGVGIVPAAKARVVSQHRADGSYNTADAILDAAANMNFGDIMLLEAQETDPVGGQYYWPVEIADANYEAIKVATALGITVVEAGCNGAYDLDAYTNFAGKHIFDRSKPDEYRESGAVMVGGANSGVPHTRWYGSNLGSRIDVYAWAESVDTTDTDDATGSQNLYTGFFGGTSGASPIIVGASAIIQGISNSKQGFKLAPLEVRRILAINGTASNDPPTDRIGVMPNLQVIIDTVFGPSNSTPDLYIRDYVGDTGATTSGAVSSSPDIIVRQAPIANPDTALGAGSGNENNVALSDPVLAGRDHSIYVRLLNRGTGPASSATATVYWSEPATLVTPNLWHQIGTVSLPAPVQAGNALTVSPRLAWPAANVPGTGHYCFVTVAGADRDPVPLTPTKFPDFVKFITENNNAAWRNFNVIAAPPNATASPDGFHRFPVNIPGAFDAARPFTIKAVGTLPQGASVRLVVPRDFAKCMGIKGCGRHRGKGKGKDKGKGKGKDEDDVVEVGIKPTGTVVLGKGVLEKESLARSELQIKVPDDAYGAGKNYEFALVQEWEGAEVGRVTWRFGPVTKL